MTSQRFNPFSPEYRNTFGNSYIRQFDVYIGQTEKIGQVVDVYINAAGDLQALIVKLVAPTDKQILLPLRQSEIDQQRQRIYVKGLSKAEVAALPMYEPHQSAPSRMSGASRPSPVLPVPPVSPLEASVPLEDGVALGDRRSYPMPSALPAPPVSADEPIPDRANASSDQQFADRSHEQLNEQSSFDPRLENGTTVRLHEERLVINRGKRRKVGEVVVRKEVETQLIEVPVQREKLIVEQISPTYERVAVVDLKSTSTELEASDVSGQPSVSGEFTSAEAASRFLDAIAHHPSAGHQTIQIKILLKDAAEQATYQQWLERYL